MGDRVATIAAEVACGKLDAGRRLAPLEFGAVQQALDLLDGFALEALGDDRSHGDPGCDLERYHIKLPESLRSTTIQLTKGPAAVPNLRPAALHPVAEAMIKSAGRVGIGNSWDRRVEVTFEALGGPLPD